MKYESAFLLISFLILLVGNYFLIYFFRPSNLLIIPLQLLPDQSAYAKLTCSHDWLQPLTHLHGEHLNKALGTVFIFMYELL